MPEKTNGYNKLLFFFSFSLLLAFFFHGNARAASDSLLIKQSVSNCDNNGICESWETSASCLADCPLPEEPEPEPEEKKDAVIIIGASARISDIKIKVEPSVNSAKILWETEEPTVSRIYWGKTRDYEEGSLAEISFLKNHAIKIENLSASSRYFLKIIILNSAGAKKEIEGLSFETLNPPDTEAPANVGNLQARIFDDFILLSWENPAENDFEAVRITKMEKFYPRDPLEGKVVYEGRGTRAEDREIEKGGKYYYSVFSRDKSGNYSSGAVISIVFEKERAEREEGVSGEKRILTERKEAKPFLSDRETDEEKNDAREKTEEQKTEEKIEKKIKSKLPREKTEEAREQKSDIALFDFNFIQNGKKISFAGNKIKISADKNLKISISAEKVSENTENLIITLRNADKPTEKHSFMLKRDNDKRFFAAVIPPLKKEGTYFLSIAFTDKDNKEFKKINGEIISMAAETAETKNMENFLKKYLQFSLKEIILLLAILFIAFLIFLKKA